MDAWYLFHKPLDLNEETPPHKRGKLNKGVMLQAPSKDGLFLITT